MKYTNILGEDFKSKTAARDHWRQMIKTTMAQTTKNRIILTEKTPIKESEVNNIHRGFRSQDYDWYRRKTQGKEIKKWCIIRHSKNNISLGFSVDGYLFEPIADKKLFTCFGTGKSYKKTDKYEAFRNEIEDQILNFKNERFNLNENTCAQCKRHFRYEELEIDHKDPTFKEIVNIFLSDKNAKIEFILEKDKNGKTKRMIKNRAVAEDFRAHHKKKAVLQSLCRPCHKNKWKTYE